MARSSSASHRRLFPVWTSSPTKGMVLTLAFAFAFAEDRARCKAGQVQRERLGEDEETRLPGGNVVRRQVVGQFIQSREEEEEARRVLRSASEGRARWMG